MKQLRKRIFAAVLAALMLTTAMPGTALYASAETETVSDNAIGQAGTEDTEETGDGDTGETETDDAEETGDSDTDEPAQEPPTGSPEDDNAETGTGICKHHQEHDADCGYIPKSEDGEGSPCTYECRICPVEDLIADLPDKVTEDNAEEVRAQLDKILDLYRELTEDEQAQIDLSHVAELQETLAPVNVPALVEEGTPDLELFGQKVYSGDSGDGWSYADGVLTLENFHSDNSSEDFIHVTNVDLEFTLYVKGDNSVKTSGKLIWGSVYGSMTITGEQGASLSLDGKSWSDRYISINGVTMDVTMQEMIFLAYDMEIDNATVSFNMSGSSGYIYTTHGGFTVKNGSDVTITNSSGVVDYCVTTNKAEITDSTLKIINPSGFGVYVTKLSQQVPEYKASVTNSTISADVLNAAVHCEEEMSVTNSQLSGSGQFLLRSKKEIIVDNSSRMKGITYEFFKSDTGAVYQVYGSHILAANLTVAENGSFAIPEGAVLTIPDGVTLENNGAMHIHEKASLAGTGVLTGSGKFLIDVNEDMISIPEDLTYTGEDYTDQITLEGSATVCGTAFTADTEGWTRNIVPAVVKDAGEYTVTFTKGDKKISKTFTVAQSGTDLKSEGRVLTYNGDTQTTTFNADDTITVKATPTATGTAPAKTAARLRGGYTEPTTGQMALFVGDVQVSEPVEAGADGIYTMTVSGSKVLLQGNAKPNGNPITLTAKFVENDNMADAAGTVDVRISAVAMAKKDGEVIGYFGVSNFEGTNNLFCQEAYADATITLLGDVQPGTNSNAGTTCSTMVNITCTLDLAGHNFTSTDTAIYVLPMGNLTIQDSSTGKTGNVSFIKSDGTLTLYGGTFGKIETAYTLSSLLAENCAYYRGSTPIPLSELEGQKTLDGTVTVQECQHKDVTPTANNDGTHTLSCPYCGYTKAAEGCDYGEYTHNDTSHTRICKLCGYQNVKAHNIECTAEASGTVIAVSEACKTCSYGKDLGTVTIHIPKLVYGDLTGVVTAETALTERVAVAVNVDNSPSGSTAIFPVDPPTMATLTGNALLSVGTHQIKIEIIILRDDDNELADCLLPFTVDSAPLTADMVTLTTESTTYNGTEQKPALTVKQGETTLTEGTDYEVIYTRDGVVTNDFTSAGTVKITVTSKGNYTGTVTKTFTIGEATPTVTWSNTSQELTYTGNPAVITEPTITLVNNENFKGTISYSFRKQGETAYKDGLPTDAGTYTVRAHVDAAGNYNAADSTNELTLTIKKADAEITVGTAAYDVNYGDPAFTISDITDTNPEAGRQYVVAKGTDVISVSNGTVTIKNAGTATITVSLPETANYNAAANKTITVTVAKKGGYTVSEINKKYYYDRENTAEINLASMLPRDCGTVTYGEPVITSGNMIFTAKAVENGVLSYTLAKGNVNDAGTITVTVTTRNYKDITVTVKVVLTDQIPVELKEGTEVTLANNILTYGESLSGLRFNKAVFVDGDGKTVEGVLAWKDAAAKPDAGTASAVWVFTPTDKAYAPVEGTVTITVKKAVPTVSAVPAVADRIYNPSVTLKGDDLTSVTVTGVDGNKLEGTWGWQSADIVPAVNNSGYVAVFTPADTTNYETAARTITVNVTKAMPYIAKSPAAAGITYGDTLNASALSGGTVQYGNGAGQAGDGVGSTVAVTGTFTWKEPSTKPVVTDSNVTEYTVVFTPSDTANYDPVEAKVTLTVNKAQNAPNMPDSTMDVSNSLEKVGDVSLPESWEWQDSDKETALEAGMAVSAVAVYIGADKGNYENETVEVTITRSACDHTEGEILYTDDGESAPTCTKGGLGHTACTKCGAVVRKDIAVPALGHDYDAGEVTKEPTLKDEGERRYTCTRCGHTYTETIPRKEPQGFWIDHMQPSMNYTGAAVRQEQIEVYYGTTLLREKVDYTISYKNNSNAGTAQVIVTGKGNYTGKAVETFEIRPVDIGVQPGMTAIVATAVETGKTLRPAVTVTWNGKKLKEKTDYTLSYNTSIKTAGSYEVTVSGTRNYTGSMVKTFSVKPRGTKLLKNAVVSGIKKSYPYPGRGLAADLQGVVVKMGKTTLIKGTDYTVRTENTDVVGTGTVIIEAAQTDAYAGEKRIAVSITGTDLKKGSIKGVEKSYPYTGRPIMPQITVYSGRSGKGEVIPADKYTVSYTNNTEKGKATVTATGIPEKGYSGSVKVSYQIGRLNLADEKAAGNLKVIMPADISHAKGGAKPQPIVTYTYESDTRILREGADYTLKYSNHTTATGSKPPTVKITGIGNYSGSITETFVIAKQDIGRLSITVTDRAYGKTRKGSYYYSAPKVYDLDGKPLKSGRDYTVQYTYADSGQPIGRNDKIEAGTKLCAVVTAHERSSYIGTLRATYVVREAKAVKDIGKVKNDKIENQPYTGSAIMPKVRLYTQTGKTKTYLTQESYEVIGCYNNSRRGTATILVRGKGAYSGVKRITFKIVQKKIR